MHLGVLVLEAIRTTSRRCSSTSSALPRHPRCSDALECRVAKILRPSSGSATMKSRRICIRLGSCCAITRRRSSRARSACCRRPFALAVHVDHARPVRACARPSRSRRCASASRSDLTRARRIAGNDTSQQRGEQSCACRSRHARRAPVALLVLGGAPRAWPASRASVRSGARSPRDRRGRERAAAREVDVAAARRARLRRAARRRARGELAPAARRRTARRARALARWPAAGRSRAAGASTRRARSLFDPRAAASSVLGIARIADGVGEIAAA